MMKNKMLLFIFLCVALAFDWGFEPPCDANYYLDYIPYGDKLLWRICPNHDFVNEPFLQAVNAKELPLTFRRNETATNPLTGELGPSIQFARWHWSMNITDGMEVPEFATLKSWHLYCCHVQSRGWKMPSVTGYRVDNENHYLVCFVSFRNDENGISDIEILWDSCVVFVEAR